MNMVLKDIAKNDWGGLNKIVSKLPSMVLSNKVEAPVFMIKAAERRRGQDRRTGDRRTRAREFKNTE